MLGSLVVLATEGGIPTSNPWSKLALPLATLIFLGSVYLLLRSNLGTRRGYLVLGTSLFGFMLIISLFWTLGAPGTPPYTGPQNLPGQGLEEYEPTWYPFAPDSEVASRPEYAFVQDYPSGFADAPEDFAEEAATGASEVQNLFSGFPTDGTSPYTNLIGATWKPAEITVAEAPNGFPVVGIIYKPTYQLETPPAEPPEGFEPALTVNGAPAAEDESNVARPGTEVGDIAEGEEGVLLFAFFDAGSPAFPSLVTLGVMLVLFLLHLGLLAADEQRERRARGVEVVEEGERVEAGAAT